MAETEFFFANIGLEGSQKESTLSRSWKDLLISQHEVVISSLNSLLSSFGLRPLFCSEKVVDSAGGNWMILEVCSNLNHPMTLSRGAVQKAVGIQWNCVAPGPTLKALKIINM